MRNLTSLAAGIGLAALALGVASTPVWAQSTPAKPAEKSQVLATVNGEPITMGELEAYLSKDGPQAVQLPESKQREQRLAVLSGMIDEMLLQQFLRQNGARVKPFVACARSQR